MSIVEKVFQSVKRRDPDQPEFHQAVWEVLESLEPVLEAHPEYADAGIKDCRARKNDSISSSRVDDEGNTCQSRF